MNQQSSNTAITPEVVKPTVQVQTRPIHRINPVNSTVDSVGAFWVIVSLITGSFVLLVLILLGIVLLFSGKPQGTASPVNFTMPIIKK